MKCHCCQIIEHPFEICLYRSFQPQLEWKVYIHRKYRVLLRHLLLSVSFNDDVRLISSWGIPFRKATLLIRVATVVWTECEVVTESEDGNQTNRKHYLWQELDHMYKIQLFINIWRLNDDSPVETDFWCLSQDANAFGDEDLFQCLCIAVQWDIHSECDGGILPSAVHNRLWSPPQHSAESLQSPMNYSDTSAPRTPTQRDRNNSF